MSLTTWQREQIAALAASPAGLAVIASNGRYELPRHIRYFNQKLLDVAAGRTKRLMVFAPPRHGKSALISHYFPAWYLGTHPDKRVILTSYEADFAASWGRKARDVLTEWGPLLYDVRVREDSSAANRWDIEGHTGGMTTAGAGGPITGRGADIFLVDDPVKNAEEALSSIKREHLWDWFQSTAYTRLEPGGAFILTLTRWHDEDLAGKLLAQMERGGERWEVVSFPALAEEDTDALGRTVGQALWPSRFDEQALMRIQATLGSAFWWYALYQQRPTPEGGVTFKREWFARRYRRVALPRMQTVVQAIDSAFKTGVGSDYSVIATWGTDGQDYYLLGLWRARVDFPDLLRAIQDQAQAYNPHAILIEDAASGQSAIQVLRRTTNLPILAVAAVGSKESRADGVSPLFEAGKILLPEDAPWLADFVEEHVNFPRGAHDDIVDTSSMALARLKGKGSGRIAIATPRAEYMDPVAREQALTLERYERLQQRKQAQAHEAPSDRGDDDDGAPGQDTVTRDDAIDATDDTPEALGERHELERQAQLARTLQTLQRLSGGNFNGFGR